MKVMGDVERAGAQLNFSSRSSLESGAAKSDSLVGEGSMLISCFKSSTSWIGRANMALLKANLKYEFKSDSALVL